MIKGDERTNSYNAEVTFGFARINYQQKGLPRDAENSRVFALIQKLLWSYVHRIQLSPIPVDVFTRGKQSA